MSDLAAALQVLLGDSPFAKRVKVTDRDRPLARDARVQIQRSAASFLSALGERLAMVARGAAHKLAKAGADDDHDHEVIQAAEKADYSALEGALEPELKKIAQDAAAAGLNQVAAEANDLERMLSQANGAALQWAQERAAELVTEIGETTRQKVRALVGRAEEDGWSNDRLAEELTSDDSFSDSRAERIARTETAMADVQGSLIGWKESGVVAEKEWIVAQDNECDECSALDGKTVPLDEEFEDGDPPLHPNCRCDVLPVLAPEEDDAE